MPDRFIMSENLEHINLISPYEKKYLTTKKLYEKIIDMPDLHSVPVYDEKQNIIIWHLWEDFHMVANCESGDGYISVETDKLSKKKWRTHWHSREEDMAITLYELGKKGNILVLKSFLGATGTVYYGNPHNYTHHTSFKAKINYVCCEHRLIYAKIKPINIEIYKEKLWKRNMYWPWTRAPLHPEQ